MVARCKIGTMDMFTETLRVSVKCPVPKGQPFETQPDAPYGDAQQKQPRRATVARPFAPYGAR